MGHLFFTIDSVLIALNKYRLEKLKDAGEGGNDLMAQNIIGKLNNAQRACGLAKLIDFKNSINFYLLLTIILLAMSSMIVEDVLSVV